MGDVAKHYQTGTSKALAEKGIKKCFSRNIETNELERAIAETGRTIKVKIEA